MEIHMKKLLVAAAFAAIAVSPALAQQGPWSSWQSPSQVQTRSQTYMYAPEQGYGQPSMQYMTLSPYAAVEGNLVIGADPDANVRLQMKRDALNTEGVSPDYR
jgi:hypothetical protein